MAKSSRKGRKRAAPAQMKPFPLPGIYKMLQMGFPQQLVRGTPALHVEVTAAAGSFDRSYDWTVFIGDGIYDLTDGAKTDIPEVRNDSSDSRIVLRVSPSPNAKLFPGNIGEDKYADLRALKVTGTLIDNVKDPGKDAILEYQSQILKDRVA